MAAQTLPPDPRLTAKGYVHPEVLVSTDWVAECGSISKRRQHLHCHQRHPAGGHAEAPRIRICVVTNHSAVRKRTTLINHGAADATAATDRHVGQHD